MRLDIGVIIVLFNPSENDTDNVKSIAGKYRGVIIDNSDSPVTTDDNIGLMHYVCNHANLGIAEAQNIGMRIIMDEGAKYIVFLDQDSRINIDYPLLIARTFESVSTEFPHLALLGPTVKRKDSGEEYKSAIHRDRQASDLFIPRRDVISSGCCISSEAIRAVGTNDPSLFIDYVDYEWCWRAASKGFICGVTPVVSITHKVGQKELRIGRQVVIISRPFRYFYQYRNYLWLLRRKYVPLQWKVALGVKLSLRILYFPFCVREWKEIEKNMFKGIWSGLREKQRQVHKRS